MYKYAFQNMYMCVFVYRSAGMKHDLLLRGARSSRVKDKERAEEVPIYSTASLHSFLSYLLVSFLHVISQISFTFYI